MTIDPALAVDRALTPQEHEYIKSRITPGMEPADHFDEADNTDAYEQVISAWYAERDRAIYVGNLAGRTGIDEATAAALLDHAVIAAHILGTTSAMDIAKRAAMYARGWNDRGTL